MQNEACHNLNIFDFLIMPIQRIPRYQMLIEVTLWLCYHVSGRGQSTRGGAALSVKEDHTMAMP